MYRNRELRNFARFNHQAPVILENYPSGQYYGARMHNYSKSGMYFESYFAPTPGTDIIIGIENSPYKSGPDVCRARVKWCKELPVGGIFGVGVNYYKRINN